MEFIVTNKVKIVDPSFNLQHLHSKGIIKHSEYQNLMSVLEPEYKVIKLLDKITGKEEKNTSPFSWYSQRKSCAWNLAPNSAVDNHLRLTRYYDLTYYFNLYSELYMESGNGHDVKSYLKASCNEVFIGPMTDLLLLSPAQQDNFPQHWDTKPATTSVRLHLIHPGSSEYNEVQGLFRNTCPDKEIEKVPIFQKWLPKYCAAVCKSRYWRLLNVLPMNVILVLSPSLRLKGSRTQTCGKASRTRNKKSR